MRLLYVQMKARRANMHLKALEREIQLWSERPPYRICREWDDLERWHYFEIATDPVPEEILLIAGDFVCCLRAALDQLAWRLAHLNGRTFKRQREKLINFLIFHVNDSTYRDRKTLFPSAAAEAIDAVQPYKRGNSYMSDPLWQLDELWRLDKHIMIPANCAEYSVEIPVPHQMLGRNPDGRIVMRISLADAWSSPTHLQPRLSYKILFGEYMGEFEISPARLREIYDLVTKKVLLPFAREFFSETLNLD